MSATEPSSYGCTRALISRNRPSRLRRWTSSRTVVALSGVFARDLTWLFTSSGGVFFSPLIRISRTGRDSYGSTAASLARTDGGGVVRAVGSRAGTSSAFSGCARADPAQIPAAIAIAAIAAGGARRPPRERSPRARSDSHTACPGRVLTTGRR
jgi:hypothetical protein